MYNVPFGRGYIEFDLKPEMKGDLIVSGDADPIDDIQAAVKHALDNPINSRPLRELSKPGRTACIVFTDITRSLPDHVIVPAVLKELEAAGVRDEDITLLCGIGMHRPSTYEEKIIKLGEDVVKRYRVVDNEPQNPDMLADLGESGNGVPLSVNKTAYEADILIATGVVEPHQYAGYSGGRKTLAIGAAGEAMIEYTHGPHMIDHPGTRLGKIDGNPFHDAITEAAEYAGLSFIVNVIQDDAKRPVHVMAGEPKEAFRTLVEAARDLYETPIRKRYDVAVAGVGHPKDANIYQASRAASYLFFAPTPVVKDGGVIIIPAPTEEGAGDGVGEQRFLEKMKSAESMPSLLDELRRTGYPPGAQRAFVMAKVLEKCSVIIAGTQTPDLVRDSRMIPAATMDEALNLAVKLIGRPDLDVAVVPRALLTLPIVVEKGK